MNRAFFTIFRQAEGGGRFLPEAQDLQRNVIWPVLHNTDLPRFYWWEDKLAAKISQEVMVQSYSLQDQSIRV